MLFNSYEFIFAFLPATALIFFQLARLSHQIAAIWLVIASLFFYGWWNPNYVGLLVGSILFNYVTGLAISRVLGLNRKRIAQSILIFAIAANLILLGYFKYANFFITNLNDMLATHYSFSGLILPLGISFFTFTQIAFLVDTLRGSAREYNFFHYALFVTYFPHLIAGPLLHHREMMPQFNKEETYRLNYENIAVGLTIFSIGLFKKVFLADGMAEYAKPVFDAAAQGQILSFKAAWGGVLSYTIQLYFDFSGYSDMAIGLSRLFGVKLPVNFDSPYKAVNIIEFWRRWHMSLSRFLRDYLYIPLGGNRGGPIRHHVNLMLTMLLGGLWHGAGWTFVIWGGLHGIYLIINHAWRGFRKKMGHDLNRSSRIGRMVSILITFASVAIALAFFRADSLETGFSLFKSLIGIHGFAFAGSFRHIVEMLLIIWFMPNTQQIMSRFDPALPLWEKDFGDAPVWLQWYPSWIWLAIILILNYITFSSSDKVSEFLYYQF
jgi:D-alanyl-lipoteichoic acid acyltransferase DltB (MBOAT superfamily)